VHQVKIVEEWLTLVVV
jgi:hypothetical protein